jgi:superfamily II DNA helicase RecQ
MVYMSPEMVLSESFSKLWKDSQFRTRLTAVIVDEAHCIDEWGGDDFRPEYRQLERLRIFTSQEVPIVCCTATATTSTFNIIWKTLGYGNVKTERVTENGVGRSCGAGTEGRNRDGGFAG